MEINCVSSLLPGPSPCRLLLACPKARVCVYPSLGSGVVLGAFVMYYSAHLFCWFSLLALLTSSSFLGLCSPLWLVSLAGPLDFLDVPWPLFPAVVGPSLLLQSSLAVVPRVLVLVAAHLPPRSSLALVRRVLVLLVDSPASPEVHWLLMCWSW